MFRKLRTKIVISNILLFGVLVFALLSTIFTLSYFRMSMQIDEAVEKALLSAQNSSFLLPNIMHEDRLEPNSIVVFVDVREDVIGYVSNETYYSRAELEQIVDEILSTKKPQGRMHVEGKNLAYNVHQVYDIARIIVYDYSLLQNNLMGLFFILIGSYVVSLFGLFFIFSSYAKSAVKPIQEAFYKQKELVANASHELKTPLTIISTSLSIINSNPNAPIEKHSKWFDNISIQTGRMSNLINDMLDLARADGEIEEKGKTIVDISNILQGVLLSMEAVFFENGFDIVSKIEENLKVLANIENMEKLFYIFIENSVKYTPTNGDIKIDLYSEKKRVVFRIWNSGEGIQTEKLPKIFDRFYRVEESHNQGISQSFGLGLSIAKSILDGMGASIVLNSKDGEFTEFIIYFRA